MAVARNGQTLYFSTAGDAVTDTLVIQAIYADGGLTFKNGAGTTIFITGTAGMNLSFPKGLRVDGLEMDAGTGKALVVLA